MSEMWVRNSYALCISAVAMIVAFTSGKRGNGGIRYKWPVCGQGRRLITLDGGLGEHLLACAGKDGEMMSPSSDSLGASIAGGCSTPEGYVPRDGDELFVSPESAEGGECRLNVRRMSGSELLTLGIPIDLNDSTPSDLEALPGIGPVLAQRIYEAAKARPFEHVEELLNIKGIGPVKLAKVVKFVTVTATRTHSRTHDRIRGCEQKRP